MEKGEVTKYNDEEESPEMLKPAQYPGPESEPVLERGKGKEAYALAQITQVKAAKKVVAPFLRTMRRAPKVPDVIDKQSEATRRKAVGYLTERLSVQIKVLQTFSTAENINLPGALYETTDMLRNTTNSTGAVLYIVDTASGEIYQCPRHIQSPRHKVNWTIKKDSTVACYVASTKEFVWCGDILADPRFSAGVGWSGLSSSVKAVVCAPILSPENEIIAIIELTRDVHLPNYSRAEVQVVVAICAWMGAGIYQNQLRLTLLSQQQLNSRLLEFINLYFCDVNISDIKVISDIMIYAKQMLEADGVSFYLIDTNTADTEADCYVPPDDPNQTFKKKNRLRFNKLRSVPAFVARTGQALNLRDVIEDSRFKDTDKNSSEITRTALCAPIMDKSVVVGVILLTNKKENGYFTAMDEATFKIFSNYCSLSWHHYRVKKELSDKKNYVIINREVLTHQMKPCDHDVQRLKASRLKIPKDTLEFFWYPVPELIPVLDELALKILQKICSDQFMTRNDVVGFILTVKKAYRNTSHHNFEHAVMVMHACYNVMIRSKKDFSDFEKEAFMISCLTHSIDHRGQNNSYFHISEHSLSYLYDSAVLQHHHVYLTKMVIRDLKMFSYLSETEYKMLMDEVEMLILHTDMENHFHCRFRLQSILKVEDEFDWENDYHRFLLKGVIMICCELTNKTKPLPINEKLTAAEYTELIKQNEDNKKYNLTPLIGFVKESAYVEPEYELKFLDTIVIPANQLLVKLLPTNKELLDSSLKLRESWRELVEYKGKRLWRPEDSLVAKT